MSFVLIILGFLLFNFVLAATLLWACARLLRVADVKWRWALAVAIVVWLGSIGIAILIPLLPPQSPLAGMAGVFGLAVLLVRFAFHVDTKKAAVVSFLWLIVQAVVAIPVVLGLKQYVAEAFIIPTGSMADSIWGYHKTVPCPKCGHIFAINASIEAEAPPEMRDHRRIRQCQCPNCRYHIDFAQEKMDVSISGGDRIAVHKLGHREFRRHQIVVFGFPAEPTIKYVDQLIGLPGETVGISGGKLYVCTDERMIPAPAVFFAQQKFDQYPWPEVDEGAQTLFQKGKFHIIRKPADLVIGMRHLVFDNDCQPPAKDNLPARWNGEAGWKGDGPPAKSFSVREPGVLTWLRYRHLVSDTGKPELITDFMAYNSGYAPSNGDHWVGDLILECTVTIDKSEGGLVLELVKGVDRFQARFNLATGSCSAVRLGSDGEKELGSSDTRLRAAGTYRLRFANVDDCIRVWVNDALVGSDDGVWAYDAAAQKGPTEADLQPAAIGAKGTTLTVANLKLWRDNYYTGGWRGGEGALASEARSDPSRWHELRAPRAHTFYVHPGHYFVLGDNSPASSDSRYWGLVPEQNMLGPAVAVYFPFSRMRWLR
jgi:signal peptidase I